MKKNSLSARVKAKLYRVYNYFVRDRFYVGRNKRYLNSTFQGGKILLCIMHTSKTAERVPYLKKYYQGKVDFFFYADYEEQASHILKVSNSSDYESNELKHINVLNLIRKSGIYNKYDLFYLIDDDTFVQLDNLRQLIKEQSFEGISFMGELITEKVSPENGIFKKYPGLKYMSGGAGYIVTASAFRNKPFRVYFNGFADVSIGLNLMKYEVNYLHNKNFRSQHFNFYQLSEDEFLSAISFHYIKNEEAFQSCISLTQTNAVKELH